MTHPIRTVAVIGAGAWGTALALVAQRAGLSVTLWAREPEVVASIAESRVNALFLPGVALDAAIKATGSYAEAVAGKDMVLVVPPAQHLRGTLEKIRPHLNAGAPVVICSKGIEIETGKLMSEVVEEVLPKTPWAVLSGPTFAAEVARGLPTAITIASGTGGLAAQVADALKGKTFRPYTGDDPVGVEIGGAVKNVIAIACGIVQGCEFGENARAAIIARGLAEMTRLGVALGARRETFLGLSGVGDLVLTCSSMQSRNFSLGYACGKGEPVNEILARRLGVTEGVTTAAALHDFARKHAIEMPICLAVHRLLNGDIALDDAVDALMARPVTAET